jgi:thiamine biosynthesis lipoprotein
MLQRAFRAMGCQMLAMVDADDAAVGEVLAAVPEWFGAWEDHISRFRPTSELSRLNASRGRFMVVSEVLWEVLEAALTAEQASNGLVTPTMLNTLEAVGYDRSFDTGLTRQKALLPAVMPPILDPAHGIELDASARSVRLLDDVRLDFGGVAKGWAADQAMRRLSFFGPALVEAGGDIAVSGPRKSGAGWEIGVADPRGPDRDLEVICVEQGGVATSGRDFRRWQVNGVWQHHLLDPRTGQPAITDVLSSTVIAPTVGEAEIAAKVALILGSTDGLEWIEAHPPLAALFVLDDGHVARSARLGDYLA